MTGKKFLSVFLTFVMAACLMTGCGTSDSGQSVSTNDTTGNVGGEADKSETSSTDAKSTSKNGKTLVVYYSASGNTKGVAEKIAEVTGGDLFEIVPQEPYTEDDLDWTDDNSRVTREHNDESLRNVELSSTTVDQWDSYDTVYIGYPIWWGIAAWPVNGFVKANDFTGKTVIPFCTAASSGIGDSGNLLKEMAGTGDWKDGERFYGGASKNDVAAWISKLGL